MAVILKFLKGLVLVIASLFFLLPIVWIFISSFKTYTSILLGLFSLRLTLDNYTTIFLQGNFLFYLRNSLIVDSIVLFFVFLICMPASYVLARFRFKYDRNIALSIVSFWFIPSVSVVIPYYLMFQAIGWLDTYQALILAYLLIDIPFVIWLLRGFFKEVPKEIEEAALLDGSGEWNTLLKIVIPLAKGGIAVTFLFAFVFIWNEFLLSLILSGSHTGTIPIFLESQETVTGIQWGPLMAATVVLSVPMMIIAVYLRRYIATGLTLGAVRA